MFVPGTNSRLSSGDSCWGSDPSGTCRLVDFNFDGDVDTDDHDRFEARLAGPTAPRYPAGRTVSRYGNPFLFTGQRYDALTGLYHFLARSYDPALGRWLQRDKLGALAAAGDVSLANSRASPGPGSLPVRQVRPHLHRQLTRCLVWTIPADPPVLARGVKGHGLSSVPHSGHAPEVLPVRS